MLLKILIENVTLAYLAYNMAQKRWFGQDKRLKNFNYKRLVNFISIYGYKAVFIKYYAII